MQEKYKKIEDFKKEFYKKFHNSQICPIKLFGKKVMILDKYGQCLVYKWTLLKLGSSSITTAIDKNSYFINQAKEVHGNKYNYSNINYINAKTKITIICPVHGKFEQTPNSHLSSQGCRECSNKLTSIRFSSNTKEFIIKANKIHNYNYNYSKTEYVSSKKKVIIICNKHGEFCRKPEEHLREKGCPKCAIEYNNVIRENEYIKKLNKITNGKYRINKNTFIESHTKIPHYCLKQNKWYNMQPAHLLEGHGCIDCANEVRKIKAKKRVIGGTIGWGYSAWENAGKLSNRFDSYKVYVIKCWNDREVFYKIGKTFLTIKERLGYKSILPYNYKILKIIKGNAKEISNLENKLKKMNKENKYIPKIEFGGMHECFNKINNI